MIGKRRAPSLPPFDGIDSRDAADRREALDELAQRCTADGALSMLCSDAGGVSFAPLRAIDMNNF